MSTAQWDQLPLCLSSIVAESKADFSVSEQVSWKWRIRPASGGQGYIFSNLR